MDDVDVSSLSVFSRLKKSELAARFLGRWVPGEGPGLALDAAARGFDPAGG